jgi:DNA-binding XRE family transcriptional regulator
MPAANVTDAEIIALYQGGTSMQNIPTWGNGLPKTLPSGAFGTMLRRYREREGMSQSELARWSCCNVSYISRMETGTRVPSRETVPKLVWAMTLSDDDADRLHMSAGYVTPRLVKMAETHLLGRGSE